MKNNKDKAFMYAAIIQGAIGEMLDEESESDYKISLSELEDNDNATAFLHALTNLVPCNLYKQLTGDETDILGFNHIANRLVYQFTKPEDQNK